jgi:hypothetical protein
MSHKNAKSSQTSSTVKPVTINLQTRPFSPVEVPEVQSASQEQVGESAKKQIFSENLLEKIINTPTPESATPVQRKPENRLKAARRLAIQAKLNIGEPNDKYEKEADETAAKVVQQINTPLQDQSVQRQESMEEEDELQMKSLIQRREDVGGGVASTDLESSIQSARGSGQSLDGSLSEKLGQAMGADFSGVKVHTDSQSDQLNKSIQAKAFTTGQDVFFRQGAYDPSSRGGQELIAHELTHVVQQGSAKKNAVQKTSSINSIQIVPNTSIQRETEMEEDDWSRESAANYMMNKQDGLGGQNKANASVWYNTMFSPGLAQDDPNYNEDQERVLKEQQAMLKRHFLAQAVFGVQGGTQFKKGKKKLGRSAQPDIQENYQPIEEFQDDEGTSANLATLASGGGRFNYRSEDGTGDLFNNFLMMGSSHPEQSLNDVRDTVSSYGGRQPNSYMGAYQRIGTHGEDFSTGHIQEVDKTTGGIDSTGFDIPIGGVGLGLHDTKGRAVTTGYQGVSEATQRGRHIGSDTTKYQTGHGFHRHATSGQQSLTQIAFEGSGPHMDNIHGGSHGITATVGKKVFGGASEKTLTGQDKRSKLGLPGGIGGVKADVTEAGLGMLEHAYSLLKRLENSPYSNLKGMEKMFYQKLLTSTTAEERNAIIEEILGLEERITESEEQTARGLSGEGQRGDEIDSSMLTHKLLGPSPESQMMEQLSNSPMLERIRKEQGDHELPQDDNDDWETD